ncbi:nitrous oxide reductase accessory protein NosL [Ideonella sp. DXS22W]|uniref:Nitrous oxide reductase accessory protein NosL n=1 Tax=Pseudaquabacterium inlustre TaxID=2984192 RepID=A0ABU9CJD7_9BURK
MMFTPVSRARLLRHAAAAALLLALGACGRDGATTASTAPLEIDRATTCDLDGMLLADYPGPKAQVHYAGEARPLWFCDTVELFATLLKPEQVRQVRAVYVQDMAKADWASPRGAWFDASTGYFVLGSKRHGSMGPTIASFAQQADAQKFAAEFGGRVLRYAEIKPEMVDLSGGALHDSRM